MLALVRLGRVVLTLALATIAVSLIIGLARPETGILEKLVLLALLTGCVVLAARAASWSTRARARFHRP